MLVETSRRSLLHWRSELGPPVGPELNTDWKQQHRSPHGRYPGGRGTTAIHRYNHQKVEAKEEMFFYLSNFIYLFIICFFKWLNTIENSTITL